MTDLMNTLLTSSDPVILSKSRISKKHTSPLPKEVIALLKFPNAPSHNVSDNENSSSEEECN